MFNPSFICIIKKCIQFAFYVLLLYFVVNYMFRGLCFYLNTGKLCLKLHTDCSEKIISRKKKTRFKI